MVNPEKTLDLYFAIKRHFSEKKFDAVKCNGRLDLGYLYHKRRDKYLILEFSNKCHSSQQVAGVLVSNFAYSNDYPFDNIEKSFDNYIKWQKNRQSMTKMFCDDLEIIRSYCQQKKIDFSALVCYTNGSLPILLQMLLSRKINIETLSILNHIDDLMESWERGSSKIWKTEFLRIEKLFSFVKMDMVTASSLFLKLKTELEEHGSEEG